MKVSVLCPDCGANYRVSADLAGKKFRCKKCPATVTIPTPAVVDAPEDEVFEALPEEDWDSLPSEPLRPLKKKRKKPSQDDEDEQPSPKKKKRRKSEGSGMLPYIALFVVLGIGFCIAGFFYAPIFFWTGVVMLCIGNFMTYSHAIENDCGLYYRFIPFYAIYYTITNIGEVWHWAVVRFAGVLFMIAYFVVHHAPGIKQGFEMGIQQEAERQAHRAEYQLTIEAYDIDEDSEEEGTFEESYSPTAEQLSTKIKSLPWMNPKKSCSVMLVKPEEAENVEESLHLSTIMAGPNAPATFQITWSVVKADSFVSMESEPFSTVDEALLVFEAFQKADPTWKDSVKWNPHAAP